ncbi:MAG: hypothetical protein M3Y28_00050 [Armatimonadota bacterium]|nr:hypothetical protein [Armatimonadota bacterium]
MNFLAHFVIATRFLTPVAPLPFYVVGNALPDLLPLADRHRRLRPAALALAPAATAEEQALRAGVLAHLATDTAFHKTAAFSEAQAHLGVLVEQAQFTAMRVRRFFLTHILVELALDAILLRQETGLADAFYAAFTAAPLAPIVSWTESSLVASLPQLPGVLTRFAQSQYLRSYAEDSGVAEGLRRVSVKARQDAFLGDNRHRLENLVAQALPVIADLAPALLEQTAVNCQTLMTEK